MVWLWLIVAIQSYDINVEYIYNCTNTKECVIDCNNMNQTKYCNNSNIYCPAGGHYPDYNGPFVLCDSECCKDTKFYGSKDSCNSEQSFFDKYKYYIYAIIALIILFFGFILYSMKKRKSKQEMSSKEMLIQITELNNIYNNV